MNDTVPFRILAVCTGNICRSAFIRSGLEARLGSATFVTSAGTHARHGDPAPQQMIDVADTVGIDLRTHRATRLTPTVIRDADLVVCAAREHRRDVAEQLPRAARVAFTLPELARVAELVTDDDIAALSGGTRAERLRSLFRLLGALRGEAAPPSALTADDIVDPYGRDDSVYAESVRRMTGPIEMVATLLDRVR